MKSIPGDIPQYLLIKAQLQARIQSGALKSGDKLPSERELCAIFNTTRITIRESLAQLESSGLIWRADRRGWFVTPERLWLDPTQNTNFHKLCREQGREPKTALLSGVLTTVPVEVMEPLQLQPFDQIYLLTVCVTPMAAPCATAKTIVCPPACLSCCSTISTAA